ncbi:TPA: hypothetical protein ACFP41_000367 [Neisseria weaveri]
MCFTHLTNKVSIGSLKTVFRLPFCFRTRLYTDNSGIERNVTEVIANEMQIIHTANRHTHSGNDIPQDGSLYNMM